MRKLIPFILFIFIVPLIGGIAIQAFATAPAPPVETSAAVHPSDAAGSNLTPIYLAFVLTLSIFLGFELISKVPSQLHTPLMSGSNAISGITLVGAVIVAGHVSNDPMITVLGIAAVAFAMINVVGGYLVTDRMLEMFKAKQKPSTPPQLES